MKIIDFPNLSLSLLVNLIAILNIINSNYNIIDYC